MFLTGGGSAAARLRHAAGPGVRGARARGRTAARDRGRWAPGTCSSTWRTTGRRSSSCVAAERTRQVDGAPHGAARPAEPRARRRPHRRARGRSAPTATAIDETHRAAEPRLPRRGRGRPGCSPPERAADGPSGGVPGAPSGRAGWARRLRAETPRRGRGVRRWRSARRHAVSRYTSTPTPTAIASTSTARRCPRSSPLGRARAYSAPTGFREGTIRDPRTIGRSS